MISCMNMITKGMRGHLYQAHSMNVRCTDTRLSLRNSIIVWRGFRGTIPRSCCSRNERGVRNWVRRNEDNPYQQRNILIYYCVFLIPIPINLYLWIYYLCVAAAQHLGKYFKRMTITFENDNDVIVYALKKDISYTRKTQQIFVAQCIWWLASIIGLEQGLIVHIDNCRNRAEVSYVASSEREVSATPPDTQEDSRECNKSVPAISRDFTHDRQADQILDRAGQFIEESVRALNTWQPSQANPLPHMEKQIKKAQKIKWLRDSKKTAEALRTQRLDEIRDQVISNLSTDLIDKRVKSYERTEGIEATEIARRNAAGECLRCAWPSERESSHRVNDCARPIKLEKETASHLKSKPFQQRYPLQSSDTEE